jgi:hypothetical protein
MASASSSSNAKTPEAAKPVRAFPLRRGSRSDGVVSQFRQPPPPLRTVSPWSVAPTKVCIALPLNLFSLTNIATWCGSGIGYAIVSALSADPHLTILLGSRDAKRGEAAVKALGKVNVQALTLDVDNQKSIEAAAAEVKQKFGGVDILINNAGPAPFPPLLPALMHMRSVSSVCMRSSPGIAWKGDAFDETVARGTIGTNYYGVKHMLHAFLPLVKANGRVVNVSSMVAPRTSPPHALCMRVCACVFSPPPVYRLNRYFG